MSAVMLSLTRCRRHRSSHIGAFFPFSVVVDVLGGASELGIDIHGDAAEDLAGWGYTATSLIFRCSTDSSMRGGWSMFKPRLVS